MRSARMVVGCMSGTSMDAIDAALVAIDGSGLSMRAELVRSASVELPMADEVRAFAEGRACSASDICRFARALGEAHRNVISSVLASDAADLIVMHGQTVLHTPPLSWQLMDPWPVAVEFDARVVTDLRSRSVASGGEGAPLTPLADWVLFRTTYELRTVVNLGGFVNVTRVPMDHADAGASLASIGGGDVGPCNLVLDRLARARLGDPFDSDGASASAGQADQGLAESIASRLAPSNSRSLGTGDEAEWVDDVLAPLSTPDALATACDAISRAVAGSVESGTAIIAGGGTRNRALVAALARHHAGAVVLSDQFGVPAQLREAMGFAVLGALAEDDVAVSLPQITGVATSGRDGQWILP